ncbi:hypothetical protein EDD86DRAFT_243807 [Gorgonomyces haynaldii]|nr:hypothetical protein EDD86DRAFT_243807 [Gorgonomyces haynaldii]
MSTTGESDRRKKPSTKVVRQWANILGLNEPKPIGQTCRFLVAFNRNKIKEFKDKSINELLEQMMKRGEKYCTLEGESLDQYIFDMFNLKDADKMLKIARHLQKWKEHGWEKNSVRDILGLTNREEQLLKFWRKSVVGIDWVGDELGHPYCALTHSIFIGQDGIANKMRSVQEEFGIRVHCGESLPFPTVWKEDNVLEHAFNMHIKILHCDLERLYNGLSEKRLRIGHGVAFLQKNSNPANNALAFIKENGIVCELNMTSNLHLLHHATYNYDKHEYALKEFLINGVKVILSTDDDGIWTIDKCQKHRRHVSRNK